MKKRWRVAGRRDADGRGAQGGCWAPGDSIPAGTRECNALLQALGRQGGGKAALELLRCMDEAGMQRDTYTYNAALNACSRMKNVRSVLSDLMADMRKRGVKPNTVTFNTLLKGAARIGDVVWGEELLGDMAAAGVKMDHITYSTFVHTCALGGNIVRAKASLDEMVKKGIQPTESTLTSFINGCLWSGDVSSAEAAYKLKTETMPSSVANAMADCLTECGRPREALELLGLDVTIFEKGGDIEAHEIGMLDSVLINSAMKALRSLKSVEWSLKLLKAASAPQGVHPDFISFNIFTDTCCIANRTDVARLAINALHRGGEGGGGQDEPTLPAGLGAAADDVLESAPSILAAASKWIIPRRPHTHQYSSLIRAVGYGRGAKEGGIDECMSLLDEMDQRGIAVDSVALTTLVDVCAHQGQPDRAVGVIERVLDKGKGGGGCPSRPSAATYNALIKAYREGGQFEAALGVVERMEGAGVEPDRITYNTLLDASLTSPRQAAPDMVLEMMRARGLAPDTTTYNTLIKRHIREKDLSRALQVPEEMRRAGLEPDAYSYALLAEACGNAGDVVRVLDMSDAVGERASKELQQSFLESLIKAHAVNRNIGAAENIVKQIKGRGASLSPKGHAALMDAYANCAEPYSVIECMERMQAGGYELNKVHHAILLKAFCNADILDEALRILRSNIEAPDIVCFNTLISAAMRVGDLDVLVNVLRHMEQSGVLPDATTQKALDKSASATAMIKVGSILSTFNQRFKEGLATAITGGA